MPKIYIVGPLNIPYDTANAKALGLIWGTDFPVLCELPYFTAAVDVDGSVSIAAYTPLTKLNK